MNLDETKPPASPVTQESTAPQPVVSAPSPNHSNTPSLHHSVRPLDGLPDEVWLWLLKDAERFAQGQIQRYCWRGARGGVLPGGFDASSIAAQAITELFQPKKPASEETPAEQTFLSEDPEHLSAAPLQAAAPDDTLDEPVDERPEAEPPEISQADMPKGWESDCRRLREEVHHRVRRQVNRLWHLKERLILHNAEDFIPVETMDGETISFVESLPAQDATAPELLTEQEDRSSEEQRRKEFRAFLGNDPGLRSLLACVSAGVTRHKDLARKLKVSPRAIHNRLRRLRRRAAEFRRLNSSERRKKMRKKVASQAPHSQRLAKAA